MNKKTLHLVKLPRILRHEQEIFGIGYYEGEKFIFAILTTKLIEMQPLRFLQITEYGKDESSQIEILGKIEDIKNP